MSVLQPAGPDFIMVTSATWKLDMNHRVDFNLAKSQALEEDFEWWIEVGHVFFGWPGFGQVAVARAAIGPSLQGERWRPRTALGIRAWFLVA